MKHKDEIDRDYFKMDEHKTFDIQVDSMNKRVDQSTGWEEREISQFNVRVISTRRKIVLELYDDWDYETRRLVFRNHKQFKKFVRMICLIDDKIVEFERDD